jgi:pimeloyl-ACP methyl ester carboxylesterase
VKIALVIITLVVVVAVVVILRTCDRSDVDPDAVQTGQPDAELAGPTDDTESAATTVPGPDGRLIDVGGHGLFVRTFGEGSPAVVIDPGLGGNGRAWGQVIEMLAKETRVVQYDRAGYGRSDVGPMPRDADRVVRELTRLLVATTVEPPYVIVGHSLGAIHALLYASEHPNLVAGVVLLDPPPLGFIRGERFPELLQLAEEMTAGFRRDAENARDAGEARQAAFLESVASEHESMFESGYAWMASVKSLGDIPLVVVGSGVPNPEFGASAKAFQEYWRESSEALCGLSTRGWFVFVEDSTHNLPEDAPEVVVGAVLDCIAESETIPDRAIWQGEK